MEIKMSISKDKLEAFIDNIADFESLSLEDKILVFGYYLQKKEKLENFIHKPIEECFALLDFTKPTNINSRLKVLESKKILVKHNTGYRVERTKIRSIETDILGKPKLKEISTNLERLPTLLKKPESDYAKEVINCLKVEAYHAAIVLMWVITISHLRNFVLAFKLNDFNTSLSKHTKYQKKGLAISKYDDFEEINEQDFLDLLKNANIISKGRHKLLNEKLGVRNTYAHPTSLTLTDTKTFSFIEDLVNDIIIKI